MATVRENCSSVATVSDFPKLSVVPIARGAVASQFSVCASRARRVPIRRLPGRPGPSGAAPFRRMVGEACCGEPDRSGCRSSACWRDGTCRGQYSFGPLTGGSITMRRNAIMVR